MAVYYVSTAGSDANNGLGPDASHASNKPWLTIGKALGAAGIASGDTVYVGPGTYREAVTVAMTSAVAETIVQADPGNVQGFKDGSGVALAAGDVIWSGYTTNDTTTPSTSPCLDLAGRDYLTIRNFVFVGSNCAGAANHIKGTTAHSTNITIEDCSFMAGGANNFGIQYQGLADTAAVWVINRCRFNGPGCQPAIRVLLQLTTTAADYDVNIQISNCVFAGMGNAITVSQNGGSGTNKGGGVDIFNCTVMGATISTASANVSTAIPCTVYNCVLIAPGTALNANTSGQIVEDYNFIFASTARTNVSAGTNSIVAPTHATLLECGQDYVTGRRCRPFLEPMTGSPQLGFGAQAGGPTVDVRNVARPAGGASLSYAVGAYERHNTAAKETSVVDAGSNAIKIVGPGVHEFEIPVANASTTISVRARYDTNHAATNKPQAMLLANGEIGVTAETVTMTAAVDTWETLTFAAQTPSRAGVVKIRLVSRSAAAGGIAYFDTFTGGASGSQGLDYFNRQEPFGAAVASAAGGGGLNLVGRGGLVG